MLTPAQLAADLGISTRQVQRLVSAGMPVLPVGDRAVRRLPPGTTARDAKRVEAELTIAAERTAGALKVQIPGDPSLTDILAAYCKDAEHLRSPDTARYHAQRIGPWAEKYRASDARRCAAHIIRDMRRCARARCRSFRPCGRGWLQCRCGSTTRG